MIHGERIPVTAVKGHIGMTVKRCDLDKVLMKRAEDEDVEFKEKTEIVRIEEKDDEVVLTDNRGENYRSRYLVLATGME